MDAGYSSPHHYKGLTGKIQLGAALFFKCISALRAFCL